MARVRADKAAKAMAGHKKPVAGAQVSTSKERSKDRKGKAKGNEGGEVELVTGA